MVEWLWEPWLPNNALSLICGDPQLGKSTLLAHLAAGVTLRNASPTRGQPFGNAVLWIRGEEPWSMATAPRLLAAGADISRVIRHDARVQAGGKVTIGRLAAELPQLVTAGVRLVVIDPLAALAEEGSDWTNEGSARSCLDLLMALADEHKVPIVASRNWNKRKGGGRLERIMGSAAFRDVPRAILSCIRHPLMSGQYVLCLDKWSYGGGAEPICYQLTPNGTGAPLWEQLGVSHLSADDLDSERLTGGERAEWQAAHELIRGYCEKEAAEASKIYAAGAALGIGKKAIWRASVELGIRRRRDRFGAGGHVWWSAPKDGWPEGLQPLDVGFDIPAERNGQARV